MMKILFFFMGVPMIILSFFEAIDVLPYVETAEIIANGNRIEISQEQQQSFMEQIEMLFEDSHTMPAFGVVFDDMFKEEIKSGLYVSMKFPQVFEVNNLPFDELIFKVEPDFQGFNLMRGMKGIVQGRCIYIDLQDKNMQEFYDYLTSFEQVKSALQTEISDIENSIDNENETVENVGENPSDKNLEENEVLSEISENAHL